MEADTNRSRKIERSCKISENVERADPWNQQGLDPVEQIASSSFCKRVLFFFKKGRNLIAYHWPLAVPRGILLEKSIAFDLRSPSPSLKQASKLASGGDLSMAIHAAAFSFRKTWIQDALPAASGYISIHWLGIGSQRRDCFQIHSLGPRPRGWDWESFQRDAPRKEERVRKVATCWALAGFSNLIGQLNNLQWIAWKKKGEANLENDRDNYSPKMSYQIGTGEWWLALDGVETLGCQMQN